MAEDNEKKDEKKGQGKLFIIVGAVVVILIVAAVAVKMFVLAPKSGTIQPAKTAAMENTPLTNTNLTAVSLKPIIVNLSDPNGDKYLKIAITLVERKNLSEKKDGEGEKDGVSLKDAMIKDTIIGLLSSKESTDINSYEGKNTLKKELIIAINKALKKNFVKDIYFTEFIIQ